MITLAPIKRRIVYVTVFEIIAIISSTLILMALSGGDAVQSLPVAVMVSAAAVIWNFVFNSLFEGWEQRRGNPERTVVIRVIHALIFEGGIFLICLPLYMVWYGVGLYEAFVMESALLLFFLIYTFLFTLFFDKIFTLPYQVMASEQRA